MNAPRCVRGFVVLLHVLMCVVFVYGADTSPPIITDTAPSGTITVNDINMTVETDEPSICKYDSLNLIYNDMRNLFQGSGEDHLAELSLPDGSYTYYIRCKDAADNFMTTSEIISFTVDSSGGGDVAAPVIKEYAPQGMINDRSPELSITTNEESTCKFDEEDLDFEDMDFLMSGTIEHTYELSLSSGNHLYYVKCRDAYNNTMSSSFEVEFGIDNSHPDVLDYSPTDSHANSVELEVSTNERAHCRYSDSSSLSFGAMDDVFEVTGYTLHRTTILFEEDGFHQLFVRCKDIAGNEMDEAYPVTIDVDVPPTARVIMNQDSPIRAGTVSVTLITSEPVVNVPELKYSLQRSNGGSDTFSIPLSGSGRTWTGYMIIGGSDDKKVGSFQFRGTDLGGNSGSRITAGNTFLVDASRPAKIDDLEIESLSNGDIRLEWDYDEVDQADVETYVVYRSLAPGVTTLDYYDETESTGFIDEDTRDNTVYYYKIAAVDAAGNKGFLSRELQAVSSGGSQDYAPASPSSSGSGSSGSSSGGLKRNLVPLVDDAIAEYGHLKKTADDAVLHFRGAKSLDEGIIEDLGLLRRASSAKGNIYSYMKQLEDLKKNDLSKEDLENEIRSLELKLESSRSRLPVKASLIKEEDTQNTAEMPDLQDALDALLNLFRIIDLDQDIRSEYLRESSELNDKFSVNGTAKIIVVTFSDGSTEELLLVKKSLEQASEEQVDTTNIILIEDVSDLAKLDRVTFVDERPETMSSDGLVKLPFREEITYHIKGNFKDLASYDATTVILDNYKLYFDEIGNPPAQPKKEKQSFLNANVVKDIIPKGSGGQMAGILAGILLVGALGFYYFTMDSPDGIKRVFKKKSKESKKAQMMTQLKPFDSTVKHKESFDDALARANTLIDDMRYNEANEIYFDMVQRLEKEITDPQKRQSVSQSLNTLYQKLSLYLNVHYANVSKNKGDYDKLYDHLNTVVENYNALCNEVNWDSPLLEYAREQHERYTQYLLQNG